MAKYEITPTSNGQFRWTLKASNGEALIVSEAYTTKQNCIKGIESSKKCTEDKNFDRKQSAKGQPYFNQTANNHQVLGTSQMYSSESSMGKGIESVKKNASVAEIDDKTL